MSSDAGLLSGSWGAAIAIFGMMVATYLCRSSGVVLMSRIRITPRVERALRALPGSIVVATILPLALDGGPPALLGLVTAIVVMALSRIELVAITLGLATVAFLRAIPF